MSVRAKVEMYERRNSQPDEVDFKPDAADKVSCALGNPVCRQSLLACAAAVYSGGGLCCYFDRDQSLVSMHPNHTACKRLLNIVPSHSVKYLRPLRRAFVKTRLCPCYSVVVLCCYTECDQSLVSMHLNHTTCKG